LSKQEWTESVDGKGLLKFGEVNGFEGVGFVGLHHAYGDQHVNTICAEKAKMYTSNIEQ
jgi:hypothetical protein